MSIKSRRGASFTSMAGTERGGGERKKKKERKRFSCYAVRMWGAKCSSSVVVECRRVSVKVAPVMREVFEPDYKLADVLFHHVSHLFPTC